MIQLTPTLLFLARNGETPHMSLIHEALQKAEIERRAGELPTLLSSTRLQPRRNASLLLPLLMFAGVLIVAAAAYNNRTLIGHSMLGAQAPAADAAAPATTPLPQVPESVAVKPAAVRSEPVKSVPEPPLPVTEAPAKPIASAPAAELAVSKPPREALAADAAPIEPVTAPPPIEPIAEVTIPKQPDQMVEPQVDAGIPTVAAAATPPSAEAIPYIFELPLETRQALPTLKVTMHVYSDDPGKRFAIIDGKRINEGGVVGNELDMVEIQRDALLMKFRNERFLMPRLGR